MIHKIVLFGPECTGKTTLAQQLAKHYQTVWVPEYSREFQLQKGEVCQLEDVIPIAEGQLRLIRQALPVANRLLICDTDLLETKVYSEAYFGTSPDWLLANLAPYLGDVYLLTSVDVPWEPDGIRDRPHQREDMYEMFKQELIERGLSFAPVFGSSEQRFEQACQAIDCFLRENP